MTSMYIYAVPNSNGIWLGPGDSITSEDGAYSAMVVPQHGLVIVKNADSTQTSIRDYSIACSNCPAVLRQNVDGDKREMELAQFNPVLGDVLVTDDFDDYGTSINDPCPIYNTFCEGPRGQAYYLQIQSWDDGACVVIADCQGYAYKAIGTSSLCEKTVWAVAGPGHKSSCNSFDTCRESSCTSDHTSSYLAFGALESQTDLNSNENSTSGDGVAVTLLISGGLIVAFLMLFIGFVIYRRKKAKKEFIEEVADTEEVEDVEQIINETEKADIEVAGEDKEELTAN